MEIPEYAIESDVLRFVAVVRPEGSLLSRERPAEYDFDQETWTFYLHESLLTVDISGADTTDDHEEIATLINRAREISAGFVNALGFMTAHAHRVEAVALMRGPIAYRPSNGWRGLLGYEDGEIPDAISVDEDQIEPFTDAVLLHPILRRAVTDFAAAIEQADDTPLYCFRAIEWCRQHFVKPMDGLDTAPSWSRMRNALSVEREEIEEVQLLAVPNRHGEVAFVPADYRRKSMLLTRRIILALFEHLESCNCEGP